MSDQELNTPSQRPEAQPTDQSGRRRWVRPIGLVATGLVAGGILAGTLTAGAQNTPADTPAAADKADRPAETALEGTNAEKAKAAALEAVEGGTIIRVETDSDGSPFEAHVRRADGTEVVVKMDKDFKVTATEEGRGGRGPGGRVHGPGAGRGGETALTGDTAEKVKAAALEAVAGGTIIRVETDSEGSPYEAHVRKADGTEVEVKVDKDFKVTATEDHAMKADRPAQSAG
jgi:uncharacterized membrane protein YkoI